MAQAAPLSSAIPQRRYFVKDIAGDLRIHLHGVEHGGRLWREHLRFRDLLRDMAPPSSEEGYGGAEDPGAEGEAPAEGEEPKPEGEEQDKAA